MMSYDQTYDAEMMRLWGIVAELSDQLNQMKSFARSLREHAYEIKSQALHTNTGFAFRRFNLNLTQEQYEAEVSHMNITMTQENIALQNDNKQLSILLKEYEQTLETVMSNFRKHAHVSQVKELEAAQHYEQMLYSQETASLTEDLENETRLSSTLSRISDVLRKALRVSSGEDIETKYTAPVSYGRGYTAPVPVKDYSLEKECELVRLEKENEELRRLLGVGLDSEKESEITKQIVAARNQYPLLLRNRQVMSMQSMIGYGLQRTPSNGWEQNTHWRQSSPEQGIQ